MFQPQQRKLHQVHPTQSWLNRFDHPNRSTHHIHCPTSKGSIEWYFASNSAAFASSCILRQVVHVLWRSMPAGTVPEVPTRKTGGNPSINMTNSCQLLDGEVLPITAPCIPPSAPDGLHNFLESGMNTANQENKSILHQLWRKTCTTASYQILSWFIALLGEQQAVTWTHQKSSEYDWAPHIMKLVHLRHCWRAGWGPILDEALRALTANKSDQWPNRVLLYSAVLCGSRDRNSELSDPFWLHHSTIPGMLQAGPRLPHPECSRPQLVATPFQNNSKGHYHWGILPMHSTPMHLRERRNTRTT